MSTPASDQTVQLYENHPNRAPVYVTWEDKTAQAVMLGHTTGDGLEWTPIRFENAAFPAISAGASGWLAVSQHESDAVIAIRK
ncbi:MAG: hypothetical protein SH809_08090 [Rhodothermales bacterium]|nr:hypothetical protein [Rhodothermales bacterium]